MRRPGFPSGCGSLSDAGAFSLGRWPPARRWRRQQQTNLITSCNPITSTMCLCHCQSQRSEFASVPWDATDCQVGEINYKWQSCFFTTCSDPTFSSLSFWNHICDHSRHIFSKYTYIYSCFYKPLQWKESISIAVKAALVVLCRNDSLKACPRLKHSMPFWDERVTGQETHK